MDKIKEFKETLKTAADTCNMVSKTIQDNCTMPTERMAASLTLLSLIGINQALIAIAQGLDCLGGADDEKPGI